MYPIVSYLDRRRGCDRGVVRPTELSIRFEMLSIESILYLLQVFRAHEADD